MRIPSESFPVGSDFSIFRDATSIRRERQYGRRGRRKFQQSEARLSAGCSDGAACGGSADYILGDGTSVGFVKWRSCVSGLIFWAFLPGASFFFDAPDFLAGMFSPLV
jgi:hypothetical protein